MDFIEIIKAIILGIVEGVTEWLPVSSTGHMILVDEFIKLNVSPEFKSMFLVVIQLGAVLAVVVLFWNKLFPFSLGKRNKRRYGNRVVKKNILVMWLKIIVACIPAAIVGVCFDDLIDAVLYKWYVVAAMLIIVGVLFIIVENKNRRKKYRVKSLDDITYKDAIIIGAWQLVAAIFPGTSRSGATIIGAMLAGVNRPIATEFTFFLAVPVMFGASLLKILKFFVKTGFGFTAMEGAILVIGMLVAFLVSLMIIKMLTGFVKKHDFKIFGWYRIILGIVVFAYFAIKTLI